MGQINVQRDGDNARPVLDQRVIKHGLYYSASYQTKRPRKNMALHASLEHIILTPSTCLCTYTFIPRSWETANTNLILFGLFQFGNEILQSDSTKARTHYTT